ncbi:outer membrane protein assembly factor BamE precursor [mine drainage metagenome]|uniref:Outer membrane protein assembly factor BamE n=1 Tax=mine drainage metagenome TaxID=410659 RepID=A0A1J5REY2_9ZZZZ
MKRFILVALPLVAACSSAPNLTSRLTPYRIDVRQGNFVTQEMVAQLKPGQTKDQVRFILGTPLLTDIFHADRWDYVYRFQPGHGQVLERRVTVYFKDGKLARVAGDVVAGGQDVAPTAPQVIDIGQLPAEKPAKPQETK